MHDLIPLIDSGGWSSDWLDIIVSRPTLDDKVLACSAVNWKAADSDAALAQYVKRYSNFPFSVAENYAFRGESDEAFKWLDSAFEQKDIALLYVVSDPVMKNLEGDARYKVLLKKMNWPEQGWPRTVLASAGRKRARRHKICGLKNIVLH